jgi:Calcineurin-like phosphoesterase
VLKAGETTARGNIVCSMLMFYRSLSSRQTGGLLFAFVFTISRLSKSRAVQSIFDRIRGHLFGTLSVQRVGAFGNPRPRSGVHITLNDPPPRLVIVGDVHGCLEELRDLLHECDWDRKKDGLVFVGDLVNKGHFSAGVIRFARESGGLCVRGNHDDSAIRHLLNWKNNGVEPPESYNYVKELSR